MPQTVVAGAWVLGWVKRSLAPSTWAAYTRMWRQWFVLEESWRQESGAWTRLAGMFCFVYRLFEERSAAAVIIRSVSALSFLFQLIGGGDVTKEFVVRKAIRVFFRKWK